MKRKSIFGKITAIVAALSLCIPAFSTASVMSVYGADHVHTGGSYFPDDAGTYEAWTKADSLPDKAGDYYLDTDVTLSATWTVPAGKTRLCLNGHGITGRLMYYRTLITVGNGSQLLICDCSDTKHYYYVTEAKGFSMLGNVVSSEEAAKKGNPERYGSFTGGYITGGYGRQTDQARGGAINVIGGGRVEMVGGTIIGNRAAFGGAVYLGKEASNIFIMDGNASMIGNFAKSPYGRGGAVFSEGGRFTMLSGLIEHNFGYTYGGAVAMDKGGVFGMTGGRIINNDNGDKGMKPYAGAIDVSNNDNVSPVTLFGGTIKDNTNVSLYLPEEKYASVLTIGTDPDESRINIKKGNKGETVFFSDPEMDELVGKYSEWRIFEANDPSLAVGKNKNGRLFIGKPCRVTFDLNGGDSGKPDDISTAVGSVLMNPDKTPSRDGYYFLGWFREKNDPGLGNNRPWDFCKEMKDSEEGVEADAHLGSDETTGDMTLYAGWFNIPEPDAVPVIRKQPEDMELPFGYSNVNKLKVEAVTKDGYSLSYQWFKFKDDGTVESVKNGDTGASSEFTIPQGLEGGSVSSYYCFVTATKDADPSVKYVAYSDIARVKVYADAHVPYKAPSPNAGLVENGDMQELINEGQVAMGLGKIYYRLGDEGNWTSSAGEIRAKDEGTYKVYYYVESDTENFLSDGTEEAPAGYVEVTIGAAPEIEPEKDELIPEDERNWKDEVKLPEGTREYVLPDIFLGLSSNEVTMTPPTKTISYNGRIHVWSKRRSNGRFCADLNVSVNGLPDTVKGEIKTKDTLNASDTKPCCYLKLDVNKGAAAYTALSSADKRKLKKAIKKANKTLKKKENRMFFAIKKLNFDEFRFVKEKSHANYLVFERRDGSGDAITVRREDRYVIENMEVRKRASMKLKLYADIQGFEVRLPKKTFDGTAGMDHAEISGRGMNTEGTLSTTKNQPK